MIKCGYYLKPISAPDDGNLKAYRGHPAENSPELCNLDSNLKPRCAYHGKTIGRLDRASAQR